MAVVDSFTVNCSIGGAPAVTSTYTVSRLGSADYSGSIPDTTGSAGQLVDMSFKHADVVDVYLVSSQNLTINVNSDSAPVQSISLTANIPVLINPFTADVTALYLRNGSATTAATVTLHVGLNSSVS